MHGERNEDTIFMEKEENSVGCLPLTSRQAKKLLFILVVINVGIFLFMYTKSSHLSNFYFEPKFNSVKPEFAVIYNIPLFHIPILHVNDMAPFYTEIKNDVWCFHQGIDFAESKKRKKCFCLRNWYGLDCGIPVAVWKSSYVQEGKNRNVAIRRRDKPRRVIVSFIIDDYIDLLDINIHNAFSIVELFLTVEGRNSKPSLLNMLKKGHLIEYQSKILPIQLNKSIAYSKNDWLISVLNELWIVGWKKLADFRPDDIFLFSHVSSIISKDVLLFLKLYDGFPEPFSFELRPLLFRFWRRLDSNFSSNFPTMLPFMPVGCTFQYIASMCDFDVKKFLINRCFDDLHHIKAFEKTHWPLKNWTIGNNLTPSGWQCNICCKKECVLKNYNKYHPKITNFEMPLPYNGTSVKKFINKDLSGISIEVISSNDPFLAPDIILHNKKYMYLINTNVSVF